MIATLLRSATSSLLQIETREQMSVSSSPSIGISCTVRLARQWRHMPHPFACSAEPLASTFPQPPPPPPSLSPLSLDPYAFGTAVFDHLCLDEGPRCWQDGGLLTAVDRQAASPNRKSFGASLIICLGQLLRLCPRTLSAQAQAGERAAKCPKLMKSAFKGMEPWSTLESRRLVLAELALDGASSTSLRGSSGALEAQWIEQVLSALLFVAQTRESLSVTYLARVRVCISLLSHAKAADDYLEASRGVDQLAALMNDLEGKEVRRPHCRYWYAPLFRVAATTLDGPAVAVPSPLKKRKKKKRS